MKHLRALTFRSDLAVVAVLVMTIVLMVLPLPTFAVDILLAANMAISILLLMVTFYLRTPTDLSTLPALILIATVFRLAISIAVTRLILVQADAGDIIRTFGEFVVGGNVVVGLVIFLIITVVQFLVITKGAERVAEVAARFTLDAMPGKQMAIDADVRAGEADQAQARRRRSDLERESQLYGAMDGAMKFVKGDAIAGLIIIVVNLIGGLAIGVAQHGMGLGQAGHTYSILTVGDGLMAQIPALFVAIASGIVVTRVGGGEADNLGGEIAGQLVRNGRALGLAGGVVALLGFVPGFPILVFFGIGGGLVLLARTLGRARLAAANKQEALRVEQAAATLEAPQARIQLLLGEELTRWIDSAHVAALLARRAAQLSDRLGVGIPRAEVRGSSAVAPDRFRLEVDGVGMTEGAIPRDMLLLTDERDHAVLAGALPMEGEPLAGLPAPLWVPVESRPLLAAAGVGHAEAADVIAAAAEATLRRATGQFVGIQETRGMLARMEGEWGELVRAALGVVPVQRMAELFRRLLDDGLSLRNLRGLLEGMAEQGAREQDPALLAEAMRAGLRRQICQQSADGARVIAAFIIEGEAEAAIRASVRQTASGTVLALPEGTALALVARVRAEAAASRGPGPVVVTALDVRRHVRSLLVNNGLEIPVLSFHDLLPDYTVQPLAMIRVPDSGQAGPPQLAAAE